MAKSQSDKLARHPQARAKSRRRERATRAAAASAQAVPNTSAAARPSNRAERAADRRQAIIDAAFDEFIDRGYAATRLDDVARRAGVAKGTIYLHFKDKQALFEELVRTALVPLIGRLAAPPAAGGSIRAALENFAENFVNEVVTTRRGAIVRLIVAEGPRFLLSRGGLAGSFRHARVDRTRHPARRNQTAGLEGFSADCRGAGDGRRDLARAVWPARATRRDGDAARPSRPDLW
jgi:AcrR family transcriptional regulator